MSQPDSLHSEDMPHAEEPKRKKRKGKAKRKGCDCGCGGTCGAEKACPPSRREIAMRLEDAGIAPTPERIADLKARASALRRTKDGKLVSARSKTGNAACSQAMSQWKRNGMTPQIAATLGKCRAQARLQRAAQGHRDAGREGMAANLERRAGGQYVTQKERLARANELRQQRAAKNRQTQGIKPTTRAMLERAKSNPKRLDRFDTLHAAGTRIEQKYDGQKLTGVGSESTAGGYPAARFRREDGTDTYVRRAGLIDRTEYRILRSGSTPDRLARAQELRAKRAEKRQQPAAQAAPKAQGRGTPERLAQANHIRMMRRTAREENQKRLGATFKEFGPEHKRIIAEAAKRPRKRAKENDRDAVYTMAAVAAQRDNRVQYMVPTNVYRGSFTTEGMHLSKERPTVGTYYAVTPKGARMVVSADTRLSRARKLRAQRAARQQPAQPSLREQAAAARAVKKKAELTLEPLRPGGQIRLGPDNNPIEGRIAGVPITTSERGVIERLSKRTRASLEETMTSPRVRAAMRRAGLDTVRVEPTRGPTKPKEWVAAASGNAMLIHPRTADVIASSPVPERRAGGLTRTVFHEAGHGEWNRLPKARQKQFADAINANPAVVDQIARVVNIKPPKNRFSEGDDSARTLSELFAETRAMRHTRRDEFRALPESVRLAASRLRLPRRPKHLINRGNA